MTGRSLHQRPSQIRQLSVVPPRPNVFSGAKARRRLLPFLPWPKGEEIESSLNLVVRPNEVASYRIPELRNRQGGHGSSVPESQAREESVEMSDL